VMCNGIGFIEVFNMASEDSCNYDLLATISSDDCCKDSKLTEVLTQANNSGVFVEHTNVTIIANFVIEHCTYMCNGSTGSNDLCWAFGEYVKFVMARHMTTPPPITQPLATMPLSEFGSDELGVYEQQDTSQVGKNMEGKNYGGVDEGNTNWYEIDVGNWDETEKSQDTSVIVDENKELSDQPMINKVDQSISKIDVFNIQSTTTLDEHTSDIPPLSSLNDSPPLDGEDQNTLLSTSNEERPSSSPQPADQPVENLIISTQATS